VSVSVVELTQQINVDANKRLSRVFIETVIMWMLCWLAHVPTIGTTMKVADAED